MGFCSLKTMLKAEEDSQLAASGGKSRLVVMECPDGHLLLSICTDHEGQLPAEG